ncbi:MAG: hypothetical protein CL678_07335 [Bdellovibrionaceae bacterium]|nr:hypothetical protein [Pseudobdellovibrionaceae bacterium]|tara:strand:- start:3102 stop:4601 length:1500 start_codon:yes stop_codon:yes gene_type:complete
MKKIILFTLTLSTTGFSAPKQRIVKELVGYQTAEEMSRLLNEKDCLKKNKKSGISKVCYPDRLEKNLPRNFEPVEKIKIEIPHTKMASAGKLLFAPLIETGNQMKKAFENQYEEKKKKTESLDYKNLSTYQSLSGEIHGKIDEDLKPLNPVTRQMASHCEKSFANELLKNNKPFGINLDFASAIVFADEIEKGKEIEEPRLLINADPNKNLIESVIVIPAGLWCGDKTRIIEDLKEISRRYEKLDIKGNADQAFEKQVAEAFSNPAHVFELVDLSNSKATGCDIEIQPVLDHKAQYQKRKETIQEAPAPKLAANDFGQSLNPPATNDMGFGFGFPGEFSTGNIDKNLEEAGIKYEDGSFTCENTGEKFTMKDYFQQTSIPLDADLMDYSNLYQKKQKEFAKKCGVDSSDLSDLLIKDSVENQKQAVEERKRRDLDNKTSLMKNPFTNEWIESPVDEGWEVDENNVMICKDQELCFKGLNAAQGFPGADGYGEGLVGAFY